MQNSTKFRGTIMPAKQKGESEQHYVSRCIKIRQREHPDEKVKQSAAVCHSMFRNNWAKTYKTHNRSK